VLLRGGVPVLPSLRIGEKIAGNAQYAELWRRVADRVRDGGRVHEALVGSSLVPGPLVQMVAVGEEAGRLEDVLERAASWYQTQVQRALKEVTALLEPLMVVAVGGVVGFIAISLMLPIFTLSRTLR
jgi:type IV pilus assembly protein PilC